MPESIQRVTTQLSDSVVETAARNHIERYVKSGESIEPGCLDCPTRGVCCAVAAQVRSRLTKSNIQASAETATRYGINVSLDGDICPGALVQQATIMEFTGLFRTAANDPINAAPEELRVASTVKEAVELVLNNLESGILL